MTRHQDLEREAAAERKALISAFSLLIIFTLSYVVVNSLSALDERRRNGLDGSSPEPWILEGSSAFALLVLFPLVYLWLRRFPLTRESWAVWVPAHLLGSVAFSLAHVLIMVAIRKALYPLFLDWTYTFWDDPFSVLLYEYRKDAVSYALMICIFHMTRTFEARTLELEVAREDAQTKQRLTLRCGGRMIWLDIKEVLWIRAASNYVEVHTGQKDHLARATLKSLESQLSDAGLPIQRVHRSYLVNSEHVTELVPTGDGDARLRLSDGSDVPASRTYRENWPGN